MFWKKRQKASFDREKQRPVLRSSICTGEQTAGFKDMETGKFHEVMLIRNSGDLEEFLGIYGISPEEMVKEY